MVEIIGSNTVFSPKLKNIIINGKLDNCAGWATESEVQKAIDDTFINEYETVKELLIGE